ncbi:hypothetical protein [Endozoicomonas ascidiicola]|uniref:hypothetical protein n=1 Tax=Endozoicomonas ascidiicola TaxID=1698521 RepID=UPI0008347F8C|nr:hypothetical protein [Endozoicomonas ascidiicola]
MDGINKTSPITSGLVGQYTLKTKYDSLGIKALIPDGARAGKAKELVSQCRNNAEFIQKCAKAGKIVGYMLKHNQRTKVAGVVIKSLADAVSRAKSIGI